MRGVSFYIPDECDNILAGLLDGVDIEAFEWKLGGMNETYVMENNELGRLLFQDEVMSGETLRRVLSESEYYLIFVDIKAFPTGSTTPVNDIATYEQFLASDCQLVLLVADSSYVWIYAKDHQMIGELYAKAVNAGYERVTYLTDENDTNQTLIG
ncbi:hypothetical protein NCCP2716_11330 [Sporosarcina sp. NCCP-2716]|uniref:DUF2691 family protein n=1 Tax=Sporosarcina sp. NCCP-2716 TaxID=2943679 RepID=UPI0020425CCF|nr:DUF2691 family protein [Sporosarcina sp. NCCP-2716]GKV68635.1 hypothetical protein NCCP2716_11330 [Sporosarcina sp. NCCP-2716]